MGYVTLAFLAITIFCLGFGTLMGLARGFRRSLLRLGLILLSLFLAIVVLRKTFVNIIMNLDIGGQTLEEMLVEALNESGTLPSSMMSLISALVEIIIGLVGYFVVYGVLSSFTWLIIYPILKIFIKKEQPKKKLLGAIVGLVQGTVIAFTVCAPLTGLVTQIDKISNVKMDGKQLLEMPAELDIDDYLDSFAGKIYSKTGGWYFDLLTSTKTEEGKKVSIDDTVSVIVTLTDIANTATGLTDSVEVMTNGDATPQQKVDAMKSLGDDLIAIGSSIDDLSDDAKGMVNDLVTAVKDLVAGEGSDPAIEDALATFDVNAVDLSGAGSAMKGIATYIEKTDSEFANTTPVTQEDVNLIVTGLAKNDFILTMISDGEDTPTILEVDAEHSAMFISAIDATDLILQDKVTLLKLFGLN